MSSGHPTASHRIDLRVGETKTITLTYVVGYRWKCPEAPKGLEIQEVAAKGNAIGAGKQCFQFTGVAAGTCSVEFQYWREIAPRSLEEVRNYDIDVRPAA